MKALANLAPQRIAFCQLVLSRIPERLEPINKGLRTLHFYQIDYNKANPDIITGGTQDNGSWETLGGDTWLNTNIADGGHNGYDALGGNPNFRMTAWQQGQIEVSFTPQNQTDITWVSDTLFVFYGNEQVPFIGNAITDPVVPGRLWHGREHVFRAGNNGLNPAFPRQAVLDACNVWTGNGDIDGNGVYQPTVDICDDFKPLGDPGTNGRLTAPVWGDRAGGSVVGRRTRQERRVDPLGGDEPRPRVHLEERRRRLRRRACSSRASTASRRSIRRATRRRSSSTPPIRTTRGSPTAGSTQRRRQRRATSSRCATTPGERPGVLREPRRPQDQRLR